MAGGRVGEAFAQSDGSYRGVLGDPATLTRAVGGAIQLREPDGTTTVFRPDGKLDYVEDLTGNRVNAVYTDGRLTSLAASQGDVMAFAYNAQGRIAEITDPVGKKTTFTYDASGEHLMSMTDPGGTTSFSYVTGQGPATEHALASVTFPSGASLSYQYDALGRLIHVSGNDGTQATRFTYDSAGGVFQTDARSGMSYVLRNEAEPLVAAER